MKSPTDNRQGALTHKRGERKPFPLASGVRQFSSESLPSARSRGTLEGVAGGGGRKFGKANEVDINREVPAIVMSVMSLASERALEEDRDIISFSAGAEPVFKQEF